MAPPVVPKKSVQAPAVGSIVDILTAKEAAALAPISAEPKLMRRAKTRGPQPWMVDVLERAAAKAGFVEGCADLLGVSARTLEGWLAVGANEDCEDELLLELHAAFLRGRGQFGGELFDQMKFHAGDNAAYHAKVMAALYPDKFNIAAKSEHKSAALVVKTDMKSPVDDLSAEEIEMFREAELKRLGGG